MVHKDPLAKYKKHQKDMYMHDSNLEFYGSMFFWFYSILCFSDFNSSITKGGKEFSKKIDTKVLLTLALLKFTSAGNKIWKKYDIPFKDLMIVWGFIFDKESYWNKQLTEILKGTGYEDILDRSVPVSYAHFFENIDSDGIDKISFNKFLQYLPSKMFIDAVSLILKCDIHVWTKPDDVWDISILGHRWGEFVGPFKYAVSTFIKKPSQRVLAGKDEIHLYDYNEWIELCENKEKLFISKLWWESNKDLKYIRNIDISIDGWTDVIEGILNGIIERRKKNKALVGKGVEVTISGEPFLPKFSTEK